MSENEGENSSVDALEIGFDRCLVVNNEEVNKQTAIKVFNGSFQCLLLKNIYSLVYYRVSSLETLLQWENIGHKQRILS